MYFFGVVVAGSDESPTGRASEALRGQLPALFPEHRFEFLDPGELSELPLGQAERLLFRVLGSEVRDDDTDRLIAECPPDDLVQAVQTEVDKIVVAAKTRGIN
jgi:hypothetical protein